MKQSSYLVRQRRINLFFVVLTAALFIGAPVQPVFAADQENKTIAIGASPAVIEVASSRGKTITRDLTISNQTGFSLPVSAEIESLIQTDEVINPQIRKQFDSASWVMLADKSFLMAEKQTKTIPVKIAIPPDATPGGHYAQISIRGLTLEQNSLQSSSASIVVPEITVSVFITVSGYINERLGFAAGNIFSTTATPGQEKQVSFAIENRGNVHALAVPAIVVEKDGHEVSRTVLTPKVALPNSIKMFDETWKAPSRAGMYKVRVEFRYGNEAKTAVSASETVLIMPPLWQLFTVALLALSLYYLIGHARNVKAALQVLFAKA